MRAPSASRRAAQYFELPMGTHGRYIPLQLYIYYLLPGAPCTMLLPSLIMLI